MRTSSISLPLPPRQNIGRLARIAATLIALILAPAPAHPQDHPNTPSAPQATLVQQANDALAAGDFPAALKLLTSLNTQTPNNPQILYDLGLTLEALQSEPAQESAAVAATSPQPATNNRPATSAEACYRAAIAADPNFAPPHIALGLLLARTAQSGNPQLAEARSELLAATTLPDVDPVLKARAYRALAHLDLDSAPTTASDDLLAALKLTPEQPDDILLAAQIAERAADFPTAEQAYRRYLALPADASDTEAISALAHVLLREQHPADAEALLTPALAQHPGNPSFTAQLAEAYLASGDPAKIAKAAPLVESLHASLPDNPTITRMLARVYVETGHPDQADPLYASLIAAQPDHPDPTLLDDRAETLIRLHRPAEAEKLLKQAVANPSAFPSPDAFADAATHLAFAAEEIDDPRATLQALALRATVQQPSPSSLFLEATANFDLHQSSKAAELYKMFLSAAHGTLPEQESQARQRLATLQHTK